MTYIILGIIIWLLCGALGGAMAFAYFQRRYPGSTEEDYKKDRQFLWAGLMFGPFTLFVEIKELIIRRKWYGFKWR